MNECQAENFYSNQKLSVIGLEILTYKYPQNQCVSLKSPSNTHRREITMYNIVLCEIVFQADALEFIIIIQNILPVKLCRNEDVILIIYIFTDNFMVSS